MTLGRYSESTDVWAGCCKPTVGPGRISDDVVDIMSTVARVASSPFVTVGVGNPVGNDWSTACTMSIDEDTI